jgi:phosphate starvation-inducible PhoH-like protein
MKMAIFKQLQEPSRLSMDTVTLTDQPDLTTTQQLSLADESAARYLYGQNNEHLRQIEAALDLEIGARGKELTLKGSEADVAFAARLLEQLYALAARGYTLGSADIRRAIETLEADSDVSLSEIYGDRIFVSASNKVITPKTIAQKLYIDSIRRNDLVFGIGPAGTGKTYLAVAMAMAALQTKQVKRIILTRPAVEAGERLGFLPGDLAEKVNPYLRPLLDAISDLSDADRTARMVERGVIEIAPLAFMRGRTLNDAFIILDEAQNTTREQMKMFLTRIGFHSQAVVNGDITQIDLQRHRDSGLIEAQRILRGVDGVGFARFTDVDVVRHDLVQRIIRAYEHEQERRIQGANDDRSRSNRDDS